MIVHTMNEAELYAEVIADLVNALAYSDHKDKKFRRMVIKSNKFPVRAYTLYKSKRNNNWVIFFKANNKKEVNDQYRINCMSYYNSPHGYYAVLVCPFEDRICLVTYAPHFFSRYAERCKIPLTGIDLMIRFFQENNTCAYASEIVLAADGKSEKVIHGSMSEGISMGFETPERNIIIRTFITYEMTKGEQINEFSENDRIRRELNYFNHKLEKPRFE